MRSDNLRCQRCEHPYHEGTCPHRKVSDWDPLTGQFTKVIECTCPAYVGIHPKDVNECDHEFLPNSWVCVHCLKPIPARKR